MSSDRLESLDVFRGLAIAGMILVSTPGDWNAVYEPLQHAAWHGWTPTDLVFPFLLFAMGAAVPFAMARRHETHTVVHTHVLRRAIVLFALGLVLNAIEAWPPTEWSTFRLLGVLQRIAIVYAIVAVLTERASARTQIAAGVLCLVGYWAAMTLVPVPGAGAGVLTPEGNLASFIDRTLLHRHMNHAVWDAEGFLSTIPAVATALCGVLAGSWLSGPRRPRQTTILWAAGVLTMAMGLAWDRVFPLNKNLWTSSFALFSAGIAAQVLALCHALLDVRHHRAWTIASEPFAAFGRNALAAYFFSVGLDAALDRWSVGGTSLKWIIYSDGFERWLGPCCGAPAASLAYALVYVALWAAALIVMYRRRLFIAI